MYPHRIRLRGPWTAEPLSHTRLWGDGRHEMVDATVPAAVSMTPPCRWTTAGLADFSGQVRFRRRFQWVHELAPFEQLWLCFLGVDYFAEVTLNGHQLGRHEGAFLPFGFNITPMVRPSNELTVVVDCPALAEPSAAKHLWRSNLSAGGGLWGTVMLEVRRNVHLQQVQIRPSYHLSTQRGSIAITGQIAGTSEQPLALCMLMDDREVYYADLTPDECRTGWQRHVSDLNVQPWSPREIGQPNGHRIQLKLLDAASCLDARDWWLGFREMHSNPNGLWLINGQATSVAPRLLYLQAPLSEAPLLDELDQHGVTYLVHQPCAAHVQQGLLANPEYRRLVKAMDVHLQHRPGFFGWCQ